ncbi:hypothetical protein DICPUDRAFT_146739 [Dictyostelium purpureum]|uniref:Uncharacterized protein n=1 Tax=Dictyostelium purpureum TaxID=5786 RepID=F0Z6W6_DICPU|nr:uncharacterized protein DICPUDRAFT_146739 [Dictyostelium purpureum]EGC40333.1 hypothetical protein DICPUDRAFT_146739 [Dictyostelium purpureum]|eukprot:XP_003283084.1 hypothetical protein DICPUDRAFT_146739 [Dictyostelium purpureum]
MKLYKNNKLMANRITYFYKSTLDSIRGAFASLFAFYFLVIDELYQCVSQYSSLTITISFLPDIDTNRNDEELNFSNDTSRSTILNVNTNCYQESNEKVSPTTPNTNIAPMPNNSPQHLEINVEEI